MTVVRIIFGIAVFILIINDLCAFLYGGWFLSGKRERWLEKKLSSSISVTKGMIHFGMLDYASRQPGFFGRWFIIGEGRVAYFSKIDRRLESYYKEHRKLILNS
jgi:hypothetical protein